jgi:hypothetical protein
MLNLDYSNLLEIVKPYKTNGRTESAAFLHWFLVNIYRLEPIEVDNIICDGQADKGIDGIYINDNEGCIDILQSKIVQKDTKTLGDTQLKEFIGSLSQLKTEDGIDSLINNTGNTQLKNLLIDNKEKLYSSDYFIRGIFITNASKDSNADSLLQTIPSSMKLEVWDKAEIIRMYVSSDKAIRATSELSFDVFGWDYSDYNVDNVARVIIASVRATEIVKMDGIHNQQLFDLNLRKSLGKTKVNKDIFQSIDNQSEHNRFLLYNNGITIICSSLDTSEKDKIKIKDYAVVNGCQSVSCLYTKRNKLTEDLRIIARIIEIKSNSELISNITYNTNNQNGIKLRDFRSNTDTQIRIQEDINKNYPRYFYQIKTGEKAPQDKIAIDNQLAGRLLIVFDLKEPWAVQGIKKIFEDSHAKVFARPEVTGGRIVTLFKLYTEILKDIEQIKPKLFQGYQITRFMLLYLLSEVFSQEELGQQFRRQPESFCQTPEQEQLLIQSIHIIVKDLIVDLNGEFEDMGGKNFDFKKTYKSQRLLKELTNEVLKSYKKLINRGRVESFSQLMNQQ